MTVKTLQLEDGRMIHAAMFGQEAEAAEAIELTDEEKVMEGKLRVTWLMIYIVLTIFGNLFFDVGLIYGNMYNSTCWPSDIEQEYGKLSA